MPRCCLMSSSSRQAATLEGATRMSRESLRLFRIQAPARARACSPIASSRRQCSLLSQPAGFNVSHLLLSCLRQKLEMPASIAKI